MRFYKVCTIVLSVMLSLTVQTKAAADGIDVTQEFLTNPGFDNNSGQGWTWASNANSQTLRAECMEFWNGTFNIWQELKGLPQGKYRLSVQAYYRPGGNNNSYLAYIEGNYQQSMTACIYAGEHRQALASPYSYEFGWDVGGCWNSRSTGRGGAAHYFPNTMESAATAFADGAYENTLEFEAQGDITIGLVNETFVQDNWCIFDNFRLEYLSTPVLVQTITLSLDSRELLVSEQVQCAAVITPADALKKTLTWTSSNQAVATVDENGVITGTGEGTATITARATDGSNKTGSITVRVSHNMATAESLIINEIMASNVDEFVSPAFNFDGWIELYNPTAKPVELNGLYLSDDPANLKKWRIPANVGVLPANGFRLIWFDSYDIASQNATFKLDVEGGILYVSDTAGKLMVSQAYPAGMERVSYARTTDGGSTWSTTANPTPGASNAKSTFATQQLAAPVVDQPSQLFTGSLSINVSIPAGTTLRYTTDGSLPTLTNGTVSRTGQFSLNSQTRNYRFRLFADGMLPSNVTTRSYIYKDKDYFLPVVSVVGDDRFLYGDSLGVLVRGVNGRPGNGQSTPCNWNMNWERPVNFSYLDSDGEMQLNQDVNLEMCGGWSRAWSPHSFKLKGTKEMGGDKNLPYPFFTQKPYIRNRTLQIRNGGNETDIRFKDAAIGTLIQTSGTYLDVQSYQPIHEFVNGRYIGLLNIREPNNKHYAYANYGWDDDEIELFEMGPDSGYVQKCGTGERFDLLMDLSADAANSETYAEICRQLDIDEYVNYMAAEFYLGSTDWPHNNVKAFIPLTEGGQWHFVIFDLDFSFNTNNPFNDFFNKEWHLFNELYPAGQERIYDQIRIVTLFKNLLQNAQFRRKFIDTFCLMGGSVFEANRVATLIDQLAERVQPALAMEGKSVWSSANDIKNKFASRLSTATGYLRNYSTFALSSKNPQSVTLSSDTEGAQLFVNGQQVPTGYFKGNLFAPVTLKAAAPAGYAFQGWIQNSGSSETTLKAMGSSWSYYDQGSLEGKNWMSPTYAETGWKQGAAPLGYSGKLTMGTVLDYGSDANNKRPTYYFRSKINLTEAPAAKDVFTLSYYIDDGLVVYVNGTEAGRFNMPDGTIGYNTFSSTYADQFPEGTITLPTSLFHKGSNTIAVEVHNNNANSTDIIFDAAIYAQLTTSGPADYYSTESEIALPNGTVDLTASFRQPTAAEQAAHAVCPVRINEISGSNNSLVCEYGKKSDWIELYNTTDKEIDVEGMYLSDNLDKPEKYQISKGTTRANTKIPAHGFLLVWCDKLVTSDQGLHASFKVSGDGGAMQLMAADKSWKDQIYYTAHNADQTVGRYPDGTDDVYTFNINTIAKPNMPTSYMAAVDQDSLVSLGTKPVIASANGFSIHYGSQLLIVKDEDGQQTTIDLFTTDGRQVERHVIDLRGGTGRLDISHLPKGFYIARATNADRASVGCKFIK